MDISLIAFDEAVAVLRGFVGRVVTDLSEDELARAHEAASRVSRLADVPVAVLGAEISRRSGAGRGGGMARRRGHRNATRLVAKNTGGSTGQAHDLIRAGGLFGGGDDAGGSGGGTGTGEGTGAGGHTGTGGGNGGGEREAPRYPYLAEAFALGDLSAAKAALVSRTLDQLEGAEPHVEQRLVDKAIRLSLEDLRKVCTQLIALWDTRRQAEKEKRLRAERYLALKETPDGMVTLTGKLDPASAAPLVAWLDAQVRAGFQARRDAKLGPAEPGEAGRIRVDALVDLARHGLRCDQPGSGVSTTVVVRIDLESMKRGVGLGSCDSLSTPLSPEQIRLMAVDSGWLPMVLGGKGQPLDVGYARRFFTPAQRLALAERDGGCAFCHAPVSWCDAHHITPWSRGGRSDIANGVLLCTRCHHRIHDDGWQVHTTATEVWFTPPASVDPTRALRPGGKAALRVATDQGEPDQARPEHPAAAPPR